MEPQEQAKAYALEKAGVTWEGRDRWTDRQRRDYLAALGEFRQLHPEMFSPLELAAAQNYAMAGAQPDIEFSYVGATVDALGETLGEAGKSVAGVGEGIFATFRLAKWLIPVGVVVIVVVWLRGFARKHG